VRAPTLLLLVPSESPQPTNKQTNRAVCTFLSSCNFLPNETKVIEFRMIFIYKKAINFFIKMGFSQFCKNSESKSNSKIVLG
jgi:hypothetical protein